MSRAAAPVAPQPQRRRSPRQRPPRPEPQPEQKGEELRQDESDGNFYTKAEFFNCYGDEAEARWESAPLQPAAGAVVDSSIEKRIDPNDGNSYTMDEFLAEYGNLDVWNKAERCVPVVAAPAPEEPGVEEEEEDNNDTAEAAPAADLGGEEIAQGWTEYGNPEEQDEGYDAPRTAKGTMLRRVNRGKRLELQLGNRALDDCAVESVMREFPDSIECMVGPEVEALSVVLMGNRIGRRAVMALCKALQVIRERNGLLVDNLDLHRNNLEDDAARALAELWLQPQARYCVEKQLPLVPHELHLSHNRITDGGVESLVNAAAGYWPAPRPGDPTPVPLWLRVERNRVQNPARLRAQFGKAVACFVPTKGCEIHPVYQAAAMNPDASVFLPYFDHQQTRDKEGGAAEYDADSCSKRWEVVWEKGTCWRTEPNWHSRVATSEGFVPCGSCGVAELVTADGYVRGISGWWLPIWAPDGTVLLRVTDAEPRELLPYVDAAPLMASPMTKALRDRSPRGWNWLRWQFVRLYAVRRTDEAALSRAVRPPASACTCSVVFRYMVIGESGAVLVGRLEVKRGGGDEQGGVSSADDELVAPSPARREFPVFAQLAISGFEFSEGKTRLLLERLNAWAAARVRRPTSLADGADSAQSEAERPPVVQIDLGHPVAMAVTLKHHAE